MTRKPQPSRRCLSKKFYRKTTGSGKGGGYYPPTPDPTEAEIRERCEAIQATWTPTEHLLRAGVIPSGDINLVVDFGWHPPVCKTPPGSRRSVGGMYGGRVTPEASFHGLVREACIAVGFNSEGGAR